MQPHLVSQGWLPELLILLVSAWIAGVTTYPWFRGKGHVITRIDALLQVVANAVMAAFTCWVWSKLAVNPAVTSVNRTFFHVIYPAMLVYLTVLSIYAIYKVGSAIRSNMPGPWMFLLNAMMAVLVLGTVI